MELQLIFLEVILNIGVLATALFIYTEFIHLTFNHRVLEFIGVDLFLLFSIFQLLLLHYLLYTSYHHYILDPILDNYHPVT